MVVTAVMSTSLLYQDSCSNELSFFVFLKGILDLFALRFHHSNVLFKVFERAKKKSYQNFIIFADFFTEAQYL